MRGAQSSAEMALKMGLRPVMTAILSVGMGAHPLVSKKRIICAQAFQAFVLFNLFVEMGTKNQQLSNVMTII